MRIYEYQMLAARTMLKKSDIKHLTQDDEVAYLLFLHYYCGALVGEAGEVEELSKKVVYHGHQLDAEMKEKLVNELGDTFWYLCAVANHMGISLEEVARVNVEKLKKRYPKGFTTEDSINRIDTTE